MQAAATLTYTNSNSTSYSNLNGVTGAIIWINQTNGSMASINNNVVIGSAAKPVILIVNGNLQLNNNVTIYGLVFVLNPTTDTQLDNNATINGAIASSTRDINFYNNATLNYNSSILNAMPSVGGANSYAKVAASWRDF